MLLVPLDRLSRADTLETLPTIRVETVQKRIDELAVKYKVSASLAGAIIGCESTGTKYVYNAWALGTNYGINSSGDKYILSKDVGYWQLNTRAQEQTMKSQGWDIWNPVDNLEAGFWLLSKAGTQPWNSSKHCWNN